MVIAMSFYIYVLAYCISRDMVIEMSLRCLSLDMVIEMCC